MITYPEISPIFLQIGPIALRWYGLAYVVGVIGGISFFKKDYAKLSMSSDQIINLMTILVVGIMLGGRLGYVLFYDLAHYLANPTQILSFWKGGMSYHGGAIGAMIGFLVYARTSKVSAWGVLDLLGIGSTLGLFLGRVANFINGELYGRVTDVAWGMVFPKGGSHPRHPSQLYEAFFEGIVLFLVLFFMKTKFKLKNGQLFGFYLIFYGMFRFFLEYFRQPDAHLGFVMGSFSMGQLLCSVMILCGISVNFWLAQKRVS